MFYIPGASVNIDAGQNYEIGGVPILDAPWNYLDTSMTWPGLIQASNYSNWGSNVAPEILNANWSTDSQGWVINGDGTATYTVNGEYGYSYLTLPGANFITPLTFQGYALFTYTINSSDTSANLQLALSYDNGVVNNIYFFNTSPGTYSVPVFIANPGQNITLYCDNGNSITISNVSLQPLPAPSIADLPTLLSVLSGYKGSDLSAGDYWQITDFLSINLDTSDGHLATIKGGNLSIGDTFIFDGSDFEFIGTYTNNAQTAVQLYSQLQHICPHSLI